jgi:hypothetical protein
MAEEQPMQLANTNAVGLQLVYALGPDGKPVAIAVDGQGRILVSTLAGQGSTIDVTDRAGRILGHVIVDEMPAVGGAGGTTDVSALAKETTLQALLTAQGTPVALDTATLAALETITVANPTPAPETGLAKDATTAQVRDRLPGSLDADGGVKVHLLNPPSSQAVSGTVNVGNLPATQAVSGPLTDVQLRATAVPVSGTFWPATQPVSLATNTPDVVDRAARLLGHVNVDNFPGTQAVSGTVGVNNFPASQAVTGPLTDTQLRAAALPVSGTFWQATQPVSIVAAVPVTNTALNASTLMVTATGAAAAAVTLTLPAAGAGLFHYVTALEITLYSSAARTGAAAPWVVTTTNLPGSPAFTFSTAGAIGATERAVLAPTTPLRASAANVATTIVCPAATGGIWRVNCTYFAAA